MPSTLLLDTVTWDFVLDINGNIAVAKEPYALAQDAASAIQTFLGELWYDTTVGVPYFTQILNQFPPLPLLKALMVDAALTVPNIISAQCFISDFSNRKISGQVQIVSSSGVTAVATFTTINPQGNS